MAKGDRSINRFAQNTGVSAAHISRLLRNLIDSPPSPETLAKLSSNSYNHISYRDLMAAAGHIIDSNIERESPDQKIREGINLEKTMFQVLLSYLYEADFEWNIQKPDPKTNFPDMVVNLEGRQYSRWILGFKPSSISSPETGLFYHNIYGMIATTKLSKKDKFTIVLNNQNSYDTFIKWPPISLRAILYVMLLDTKKGILIKEEKICSYS